MDYELPAPPPKRREGTRAVATASWQHATEGTQASARETKQGIGAAFRNSVKTYGSELKRHHAHRIGVGVYRYTVVVGRQGSSTYILVQKSNH
jgi:outer membrane biosynthesis protein TonB